MAAASRPQQLSRRPSSSEIASTPLTKLPQRYAAEAKQLFAGGPSALKTWLAGAASADNALRKQGLSADELCAAVVRGGGGAACEEGAVAEARFAQQLIAQVLWEAELCALATAGRAKDPEVPTCLLSGQADEPESETVSDRGSAREQRSPLPVPPSTPPPTVLWAPAGPPRASAETRLSTDMPSKPGLPAQTQHSVRAERRQASRERAQRHATESLERKQDRWNEKEKVLEEYSRLRIQHVEEIREKVRQQNEQTKGRQAEIRNKMQKQEADLQEAACRVQQRWEEQVARAKSQQNASASVMSSAFEVRRQMHESNRQQVAREAEERLHGSVAKAEKAREEAWQRRECNLRARSAGPPELRAVRELARKQAARVERIREAERETLRQRLEESTSIERLQPSSSARQLTASSVCGRPVGHGSTDGPPASPRRLRPASAGAARRPVEGERGQDAEARPQLPSHAGEATSSDTSRTKPPRISLRPMSAGRQRMPSAGSVAPSLPSSASGLRPSRNIQREEVCCREQCSLEELVANVPSPESIPLPTSSGLILATSSSSEAPPSAREELRIAAVPFVDAGFARVTTEAADVEFAVAIAAHATEDSLVPPLEPERQALQLSLSVPAHGPSQAVQQPLLSCPEHGPSQDRVSSAPVLEPERQALQPSFSVPERGPSQDRALARRQLLRTVAQAWHCVTRRLRLVRFSDEARTAATARAVLGAWAGRARQASC